MDTYFISAVKFTLPPRNRSRRMTGLIKKIDLLREYRRLVRETGDVETAVAALAATPFVVPTDLDASDVADFEVSELPASAKRGTDVIESRETREKLLRALIARNPYGGGRPTQGAVATRRLSATIPGDVLDALDAYADSVGASKSAVVTDALTAYLRSAPRGEKNKNV